MFESLQNAGYPSGSDTFAVFDHCWLRSRLCFAPWRTRSEAMWKKENDVGTQPTPTMATYSEAMDKFTKSATAFMEHVHHLTQARDAYQEVMTVSTAIRNSLDAGDQALRSLLLQLEQAVNFNLGKPPLDKKRPEPVRAEAARADGESTGAVKMFP